MRSITWKKVESKPLCNCRLELLQHARQVYVKISWPSVRIPARSNPDGINHSSQILSVIFGFCCIRRLLDAPPGSLHVAGLGVSLAHAQAQGQRIIEAGVGEE